MSRDFLGPRDVAGVVATAFGAEYVLTEVTRLKGGSKKGVYRLTFADAPSAILYVWDPVENYWPTSRATTVSERADPFADASGAELFEASYGKLAALGVRTPRLHLLDRSKTVLAADFAILEDVRGLSLERMLAADPLAARPVLAELAAVLQVMHAHRSPSVGKVAIIEASDAASDQRCEQIVLRRALAQLGEAADRVDRLALAQAALADLLQRWTAEVVPRSDHGLIHGELGPDHVLIDDDGHPAIIDIEGLMFFDVEWEHAFLELRFHDDYRQLRADALDEQRLRLYRLALHISLVAGPLRLLDGDFPDAAFMRSIVEWNLEKTLSFVE
jgi:Phosphotransferase enzyme family